MSNHVEACVLRANHHARETDALLPSGSRRLSFAAPQVREKYLIGALSILTLVALLAPALPASAWHTPHFVDTRTWLGLHNAGDVLSNLAFLAMGVWGLVRLRARNDALVGARFLFVGLILTCIGSSIYHLDPTRRSGSSPIVSAWRWRSPAFWASRPASASACVPVRRWWRW
ncbi:hypothetical protein ACQ5SK_17920 [Bradyrhizobium japonicum]